jgi:hypothetical protein
MSIKKAAVARRTLNRLHRRRRSTQENGRRAAVAVDEAIVIIMLPLVGAVEVRGEKLQLPPTGRPEQLSFTCWSNPFCGVMVNPICPEVPGARVITG